MKNILKQIILEQQEYSQVQNNIPRKINSEWLTTSEIVIISGVRRCGKSVLLQQIREQMKEQSYFINFDDDRLINFKLEHFNLLEEAFFELFDKEHTYYFDEIQNIEGWERFVRRLYNAGNKIFITGSNAKMLSRELGTHLTGRYIQIDLYPFSFKEYLDFKNYTPNEKELYTTLGKTHILSHFKEYMQNGGFPKYIQELSYQYISALYQSIIYRDILSRNNISNEREILELMHYIASNIAKRFTYTSLAKTIGIKHPDTIKNYLDHIESTYLIFSLFKYDPSLKKQMANAKKIYLIDNAIANKIGFNATDNFGSQLENLVFIELKRRGAEIFYHSNLHECDFIIRQGIKITEAYQVTMSISNPETRQREIKGLLEALETYNLPQGYILTLEETETITINDKTIQVIPVWKWLLDFIV